MARSQIARVNRLRTAIIAIGAVVIVALIFVGILYSSGQLGAVGSSAENRYRDLGRNPHTLPIEIVEYFSYACIHCRNFDPVIEDWKTTLPAGVQFRRAHVGYSSEIALLARSHYALEHHDALERNHARLFRAIHDRGKRFQTAESIADYVDGFGIKRAVFLSTIKGRRISELALADDQRWREYGLTGVPALVVADNYVINMDLGRTRALKTVDALVNELLAKSPGQ